MLFIINFILVALVLVIYSYKKYKKESYKLRHLKISTKYDFIKLMNNLLEQYYPKIKGNSKYYLSSSIFTYVNSNIKIPLFKNYYIVSRFTIGNIFSLIGLYIGGYKVKLSDMIYRIDSVLFNDLMLLYDLDLSLWENKITNILEDIKEDDL